MRSSPTKRPSTVSTSCRRWTRRARGRCAKHLVHHTGGFPGGLAIRAGSWKLIAGAPAAAGQPERKPMLFNLADDPAEEHDLAAAEPERVAELAERLATIRKNGRSRPLSGAASN